ncbi:hypothetical protein FB45DRAFT_879513 [Roridomyces roridus]|uniref:Uncharacterized protein n=1 Tax=Roridomyces roridus TaxID=1738132 RepID=A0AAD7AZX1_9AGAR|nr:hypothetical protein FB45DRAFT_879513 [Roridomyces roridus]
MADSPPVLMLVISVTLLPIFLGSHWDQILGILHHVYAVLLPWLITSTLLHAPGILLTPQNHVPPIWIQDHYCTRKFDLISTRIPTLWTLARLAQRMFRLARVTSEREERAEDEEITESRTAAAKLKSSQHSSADSGADGKMGYRSVAGVRGDWEQMPDCAGYARPWLTVNSTRPWGEIPHPESKVADFPKSTPLLDALR